MQKKQYTLEDFNFRLPETLIAQTPPHERDKSRLLVLDRKTGEMQHQIFSDIENFLMPGDLLVFNNARVIHGRLFFRRESGGKAELILIKKLNPSRWIVISNRTKRLKTGEKLFSEVDSSIIFKIINKNQNFFEIESNIVLSAHLLEKIGQLPLPPYITRDITDHDWERYQTVYASAEGSVAAPTAGLHFTDALIGRLQAKEVQAVYLTLDISYGTFQPVREKNLKNHRMHSEQYHLSESAAEKINSARKNGGRIIAVGTTVVRVLETTYNEGVNIPSCGETDIFIYPPQEIKSIDSLITNFHIPYSTLLMLVASFAGHETIMKTYDDAVQREYRFFSYGDSMAIF